ncbi:MAG: uroporphyrinogen decarboxylase [Hyphomicrobiaceae bacterium]|jgi:uroporphyrinogen decarboxylase
MSTTPSKNRISMKFIRAFEGNLGASEPPPIWLMRQAGRYLAEYRKIRSELGSFLDLCYTPEKACEVTLQPINRFDFDAAILFSDILIVPHALGQPVRFVQGEGPRLDPITSIDELPSSSGSGLDADGLAKFSKVYEAVSLIRNKLSSDKALIGFCGAPYTVATYMIAGQGSPDQAATRTFAFAHPEKFQALIDLLVHTSTSYLCGQIDAGVNAVQIFDSWSGPLPDDQFRRWVVEPTKKIVAGVRAHHPDIPIIGFPRGSAAHAREYIAATGVNGIGCDTSMPLSLMSADLGDPNILRQGNLDPLLLLNGGPALDARIREIRDAMRGQRFIFNLGHGILPPTPIEHVQRLVDIVREPV